MALAGELAKYIGGELVKNTGKELATNAATSALSNLAPKIATKAGASLATKSVLNSLVPTATRKLASGIELGTDMIPLFRGQTNRLDRLDYNKGLSPNSNGFFMTPNKSATDSWAGKGVVSVDADPNDIMTLDELRSLKKSAEKYFRDPKYQMELYNTNPTQAEIYDALEAGDSYQELSRLTKKPFIERDGGQGTELGEVVFFPDTRPELTTKYNDLLASGENQWATPAVDETLSGTSVPAGTKISFNKDLSINSINEPSRGRGWFADNSDNPHIAQAIKQSGADKYLGEPKINYSLAEEPDITLYHGTPNKFEDFDESLPSVWFSDSDKNLRDTGLSIGSGQNMNIMKRQLPKDLKIADEDLADRLTKQQLQDRGYAGIAYTERGPNGDETYYEIFSPNKTLRKMPEVQQSLYGGGYGRLADDAKKIGSAEVATIDPETLPGAYDKMKDYLADYKNIVPKAIGKPASKVTKADLVKLLEDYGYDTEGTKWELWNTAQDALEDEFIDELYENNGEIFARFLGDHRGGAGITGPGQFKLGSGNRATYLDSVYSDRLGIGRSHTPMADSLNKYNRYGMDTAGGDYMTNGIGINLNSWGNEGEGSISTIAHERMHAWQDQGTGWNYPEEFRDAYTELRNELKPFFHDKEQILKDHPNSQRELDYWIRENEQEARMLQSYLENEGFTKTGRKPEWGKEIKPAFDKFYKKLRAMSKKGIALPAIAGLFGLGALANKKDDKNVDNIK